MTLEPSSILAMPLRKFPLRDLGGSSVDFNGFPSFIETDRGSALLLSSGMQVRALLPSAATDRLTASFWLRANAEVGVSSESLKNKEVQIPIISAFSRANSSQVPVDGWSLCRIRRTDGVSDFVFTAYDAGIQQSYRFIGNNDLTWQFVSLHFANSNGQSRLQIYSDGQLLEQDGFGTPLPFTGSEEQRLVYLNRQFPAINQDVINLPSANDCIYDLFVSSTDIEDEDFIYESIANMGLEESFSGDQVDYVNISNRLMPIGGVAGVAETASGIYAVTTDGFYHVVTSSQYDAARNLKRDALPPDVVPYKVLADSTFSISAASGLKLKGSGAKLL